MITKNIRKDRLVKRTALSTLGATAVLAAGGMAFASAEGNPKEIWGSYYTQAVTDNVKSSQIDIKGAYAETYYDDGDAPAGHMGARAFLQNSNGWSCVQNPGYEYNARTAQRIGSTAYYTYTACGNGNYRAVSYGAAWVPGDNEYHTEAGYAPYQYFSNSRILGNAHDGGESVMEGRVTRHALGNGKIAGPLPTHSEIGPGDIPEYIAVYGDSGVKGYAKKEDLFPEMPSSPEEAVARQKIRQGTTKAIPLFGEDGETEVGTLTLRDDADGN